MKLKFIIPFVLLFVLLGILCRELFYAKPHELPSALIGESLPNFSLPLLFTPEKTLTPKDFAGHVSLLNVWASWCYACQFEQPFLMQIREQYHIPIYGMSYKDKPDEAKKWLEQYGNPFVLIGLDKDGNTGIDLGVYGTPETFVISREGKIVYRHVGAINQEVWDDVLYPVVKKYE